jgi:hypothetical protein
VLGNGRLEGPFSGDIDLDADAGALLVRPERITAVHPIRRDLLERARQLVCEDSEGEPCRR